MTRSGRFGIGLSDWDVGGKVSVAFYQCCFRSGPIVGRLRISLGWGWNNCGVVLGSIWGGFGIGLGSVWDRYGVSLRWI